MGNSVVKNASIYTIGSIIPQATGFFLLPIYTKYLSPADYGIVSSMQVIGTILIVFFTLSIDRAIYRLYFDYKTEDDKKDFLGTITIAIFFISIFVLTLVFAFQNLVGKIYENIDFYPFYVYAILTAFFSVFSSIPKKYYQLNGKPYKFIAISILQFILSTSLILWFVVGEKTGAEGMLRGNLIASILMLPILICITYTIINFRFKLQILKETLSFSLPIIPSILSAWILNLSDRVFIERYFDLHDVGIYALGYKIAGLGLIFSGALKLAYSPVFYKLASSENQVLAKKKISTYNYVFRIVILMMMFLIILFSKEVIQIALDAKYLESYKIVYIISFAYFISQTSGLFNMMIYQEKKVKQMMFIMLFGSGMNILLNFILIPPFGMYGAAYATVISFLLIFFLSWWYAKKCYYIPPQNWRYILLMLSFFFAILILFEVGLDINIFLSLMLKFLLCGVIGLIIFKKYMTEIIFFLKRT